MTTSGETDIDKLLESMAPEMSATEYVFCTFPDASYGDYAELMPIASYSEKEGLTLVFPKDAADSAGHSYQSVFTAITLTVHSSLDAVGLTAVVSARLARAGISANVIAGYYHDHIFVPADKAEQALLALQQQ